MSNIDIIYKIWKKKYKFMTLLNNELYFNLKITIVKTNILLKKLTDNYKNR